MPAREPPSRRHPEGTTVPNCQALNAGPQWPPIGPTPPDPQTRAGGKSSAVKSLAWVAAALGCAATLLTPADRGALAYETLAAARAVPAPEMPVPGYLQPASDPTFGTPFVRVTDPGRQILPGISCRADYCRHRYSSAQAWNADQTLLVIAYGCPGLCFLDGQSYQPLFRRAVDDDCEWHPSDPARMICVSRTAIYAWEVRGDVRTILYAPGDYGNLRFGPGKGNLSKDGRRLVVRAANASGALVAFAYDITAARKYPDIELGKLAGRNSYCGISPSGRYVFCFQVMFDSTNTAYVFDPQGVQLQHWTDNHRPGHGDMTIDSDGNDVYVGVSKDHPDKYHVIKRRLEDGVVTDLAPQGEAQHASIRNINRPGWVFLTYGGSYANAGARRGGTPFYQEVVALRIDGSGEVRRIVHTRSVKHDYRSEAHASPSPDGTQVIWSSNWGEAGGPVADYVARVSWPEADARLRAHGKACAATGGSADCGPTADRHTHPFGVPPALDANP
jgi:hypothetical protein